MFLPIDGRMVLGGLGHPASNRAEGSGWLNEGSTKTEVSSTRFQQKVEGCSKGLKVDEVQERVSSKRFQRSSSGRTTVKSRKLQGKVPVKESRR